jgi:hypothetical protein
MTTPPPHKDHKIRFNMEINLGHVLSAVAFVVTAMVSWNVMDKRVLVLEEHRIAQRDRDASQRERDVGQDVASKEKFQEVRDAIKDLRTSVDKVADKLGAR